MYSLSDFFWHLHESLTRSGSIIHVVCPTYIIHSTLYMCLLGLVSLSFFALIAYVHHEKKGSTRVYYPSVTSTISVATKKLKPYPTLSEQDNCIQSDIASLAVTLKWKIF